MDHTFTEKGVSERDKALFCSCLLQSLFTSFAKPQSYYEK